MYYILLVNLIFSITVMPISAGIIVIRLKKLWPDKYKQIADVYENGYENTRTLGVTGYMIRKRQIPHPLFID